MSSEKTTVPESQAPLPAENPTPDSVEEKTVPVGDTKTEQKAGSNVAAADDDLDDLDDLLDDFADDVLNKPPGSALAGGEKETGSGAGGADTAGKKTADAPLNDEFKLNIEGLIKDLNIEDPETKDQFEDLVKQFEVNHRADIEAEEKKPYNFEYVMKETMERLKKSGETVDEKIKNDPSAANPEDMLSELLAGFGGAGGAGDMDMSKLLSDMLEQLSSKEVLYEPIKDLNTKLPGYLKENKGVINEVQYAKYSSQYDITGEILAVFDAPGYSDDQKDKREKVNSLLESLQEFGQPPVELVGEGGIPGLDGGLGGDGLDFNDKDLPKDLEKQLEDGCKQQ
ncbi:hypothetical protein G9P44_002165 [Scheffersomyces stipitis]|nr:hypothetical protein G9P44_002165 [Scheffersomyces stipitis]